MPNLSVRNKYTLKVIQTETKCWRRDDCAPCTGLKVQRQNDGWSKKKVKIYIKEWVYLCVCTYDQEVLNGVSFSLCALNFRGVCLNPDPASSSSLSWCCDDGDGTLTDVCSPLCPSLELEAWWGKEKNDMPSQMCHNTTLPHECDFYDTCSKGTWLQSWRLHLAPSFQRNVSICSGKLKWHQWMLITHQPTNFLAFISILLMLHLIYKIPLCMYRHGEAPKLENMSGGLCWYRHKLINVRVINFINNVKQAFP